MKRKSLSISVLPSWSRLNNVEANGAAISAASDGKGLGIFATEDLHNDNATLITVPKSLVLSLETVWDYAKSDHDLHEVLTALGDFGKTARGAILTFLLFQMTQTSLDATGSIGNANPWTEYTQFLPTNFTLPTFWTESERTLTQGTSLEPALNQKLTALDREFTHLRTATEHLACCKCWWDKETGCLTVSDYLQADALHRSRSMDLPGTGIALVPCIDMANHASGSATNTNYETDSEGNAVLVLLPGQYPKEGDELVITYGDEKGACEMLFSYGFIDHKLTNARSIFLSLAIPDDDPLKIAKLAYFDVAPGFRVYEAYDAAPRSTVYDQYGMPALKEPIAWSGPFVWLQCINEEDGLDFRVLQLNDGGTELYVTWKGEKVKDILDLAGKLEEDDMWDLYRLRAFVTMRTRMTTLRERREIVPDVEEARPDVADVARRLGDLEMLLLRRAIDQFDDHIGYLSTTPIVRKYLGLEPSPRPISPLSFDEEGNQMQGGTPERDELTGAEFS